MDNNFKIIVLILQIDDVTGARSNYLKNLFTNPLFKVEILNIPEPPSIQPTNNLSGKQITDNYRINKALTISKNNYDTYPIIVIKDSSITYANKQTIISMIEKVINNNVEFDIYYLCKWLDMCQKYTDLNLKQETFDGSKIVSTQAPYGIQSLMFTPHGRDIILGIKPMRNGQMLAIDKPLSIVLHDEIMNANIKAICTVPNLFNFDISLATHNNDYMKLDECKNIPPDNNGNQSPGTVAGYVWFAVILLLVLIVAWAVMRVGPRP